MRLFTSIMAMGVVAAVVATTATSATADHRRKPKVWEQLYPGEYFVLRPRNLRYIFGGYVADPDDFDDFDEEDFDETYYEPEVSEPPSKNKKKTVEKKKAVVTAAPAKPKLKSETKTASVSSPSKTAASSGESKKTAAKGPLSCDKAGEVIGGFGFASVKPEDCSGQVYAFNAMRDGKAFAVRINAASGELTEVKKLQ